jgi:hypothetical protein
MNGDNVNFVGDWDAFFAGMAALTNEEFFQACMEDFVKVGQKAEELLKTHIIEQDLPWKPLSEVTVSLKGHDVIFIETGKYYDGIRLETAYTGKAQATFLVYPSGTNENSGVTYDQIAFWQEYGTTKIPSRSLWRVVVMEIQETVEFKRLASLDAISRVILKGSRRKRHR